MERKAWGFSLFCDDLRSEVGGKTSIMGTYAADLLFRGEFPFTLAKFAILIKYYEDPGAFTDDIQFRIFFPGDHMDKPTIEVPVERSNIQPEISPGYELEKDQSRIYNLTLPVMVSPLVLKQEGFIKVRAVCGGTTTNLGSLRIQRAGPEGVQAVGAPNP